MSNDNETNAIESPAGETKESCCGNPSACCEKNGAGFIFPDLTWVMLLLRAWIGLRMLLAGWVKFRSISPEGVMTTSLKNYYGEGPGTGWVHHASEPFWKYGALPQPLSHMYSASLGWLMLLGGTMILLGITNRLALIFGAAVMLSLSFGLFTLDDSQEIGYISGQFALFVAAIALARHNRLMVFGKF